MVQRCQAINSYDKVDAATESAVKSSKIVVRDAYKLLADTQHLVKAGEKN